MISLKKTKSVQKKFCVMGAEGSLQRSKGPSLGLLPLKLIFEEKTDTFTNFQTAIPNAWWKETKITENPNNTSKN